MAPASLTAAQTRPEPMNVTQNHPKVKVSITLPKNQIFVAGEHVSGRMEMECRAEGGELGIGRVRIELFAIQELTSRDHSAHSLFLHATRVFQGPGLPPSNAVHAYPQPGDPPLPANYYPARRGIATFLFRFPIPKTAPGSINFGGGVAKVKYELRASVGVIWRDDKREVVFIREVGIVESWNPPPNLFADPLMDLQLQANQEGVVVGEGGKMWAKASIVGGFLVAGEPGCIELMVKNHSNKKNSGLTVTLSRILILPAVENSSQHKPKEHRIHISDTLLTVPFRGSEYVIQPGVEGVASLVFDVPETAKGVRGGTIYLSDEAEDLGEDASMAVARGRRERDWRKEERKESLFEVRCVLGIKIDMGIGSKDIQAELTAPVFHPVVVPDDIDFNPMIEPYPYAMDQQIQHANNSPGPMSAPIPAPYPFQPNMPVPYPVQSPIPGQYYQPQPVYNNLPPAPLPGVAQSGSPVAYLDEANNRLWLSPPPHAAQSPMPGQHLMDNGMFIVPHRSLSASPGAIPVSPVLDSFQNQHQEQPFAVPLSPGYGYPNFASNVHNLNASPGSDSGTGLDAEEGKGQRAARVAAHLRMSSRHRSVSPTPHRFPMGAPSTAADIGPSGSNAAGILSTSQNVTSLSPRGQTGGMKKARTLPQLPMPPPPPVLPDGSLEPEAEVLSPRPLLSPRTSYTDLRSPKSDSVKTLEKLAEDVDRTNGDLSGDSGLAAVANASPVEKNIEVDCNKTLPKPPPATITLTSATPEDVSQVHAAALPDSGPPTKAHPTPRAAITPMRLDHLFTPKVSAAVPAESNLLKSLTSQRKLRGLAPDVPPLPSQSSPDAPAESGLDVLERRLLAEVGTRKVDIKRAPDVRDILAGFSTSPPGPSGALSDTGSQPVAIPRTRCIGAYDEPPINDSCISSFTLAGEMERDEWEREREERERERERNAMVQAMVERELQYEREAARKLESLEVPGEECDADVDSDDRTHRGKRSHISAHSGSGESRRTKRSSDGKKKHKSRSGKSRKSDGDGEGSSSEGRRKSGRKKDKAQNGESHANRTKKKAEAAKGRVAAWLGTIEPEVPPEEDVVVASPVVEVHNNPVLGFEDPSTAEWSKDAGEPKDVPTLPTQDEDVSALPNPRSSGFVPIGTLKNEWNTFQLRRAHFDGGNSAKVPVDGETMRIRNIWSSVGASPPSQSPPKSQKLPILLPTAARPILKNGASPTKPTISPCSHAFQSIRTDRRVSPPSSTAVLDILGAKHFAKSSIPSPTTPPRDPTVPPLVPEERPVIAVPKQSPRVPAFPPLSKALQAPEVKYDVRSARGGRGGQVTAMASLWASGAGNQPEPKPGHLEVKKPAARLSSPTDHSKVMPISPVSTPASSPVISTQPKEPQTKTSAEAIPVAQKTPAPIRVSVGGITVGKSSAPRLATVPEVASTKPAIKATSVPAVISSSLAIPTLSSTASLVRPVQKVRSSFPLQPSVTMLPAINEQKAGDRERVREPRHSVAVASPTKSLPSSDLGFGKARLRELIKKYQG